MKRRRKKREAPKPRADLMQEYLRVTGLSQDELAQRMSMDHGQLNRYITGALEPGPKVMQRISDCTGIKLGLLVASFALIDESLESSAAR